MASPQPLPWRAKLVMRASKSSQNTLTTYYTADEFRHLSISDTRSGKSRVSTPSTFYSVEDPAVITVDGLEDLRAAFSDLDITDRVRIASFTPVNFGGQGHVLKGTLPSSVEAMHMVAIKIVRGSRQVELEVQRRLAREIGIWHTLSHPNILPLVGLYWGHGDLPATVSPWCSKGNALEYLRAQSLDSEHDSRELQLRILTDALNGLSYLHGIAVVHGDLKGANVLICNDGTACLGDFGVSAVLHKHPSKSTSGEGTFRWMAPDLFADHAGLTRQTDMWAAGCVILELTTLCKPYHTIPEDVRVILALFKHEIPDRPPGISDALWRLCLNCFALEPTSRPTADELLRNIIVLARDRKRRILAQDMHHYEPLMASRQNTILPPGTLIKARVGMTQLEDHLQRFCIDAIFAPDTPFGQPPPACLRLIVHRTYEEFITFHTSLLDSVHDEFVGIRPPLPATALLSIPLSASSAMSANEFRELLATEWCRELDEYMLRVVALRSYDVLRHELVRSFLFPRMRQDGIAEIDTPVPVEEEGSSLEDGYDFSV